MGTWIVGVVVLIIVGFAVYKVIKDRKSGKGCGCGCDNCNGCPASRDVESFENRG